MKRFHVSKNLFDDWYETGVLVNGGGVDSSSAYANYRTTDYISVDTTPYTFSLDNTFYSQSSATSSRAAFYDENKNFLSIQFYYNRPERFEQTINIPNNTKYIRLTGRITDENVMLNTGSTPLPYEPYGNTWQTKSPPKYGTSTDTITTLPADIYADGNSATVGLVGNMSQTGTPTPSSPIYPTETGDKTANLLDLNALINAPSGTFTTQDGTESFTAEHLLTIQGKPNTYYNLSSNYRKTGSKKNIIYLQYADSNKAVTSSISPTYQTDNTGVFKVAMYTSREGANDFINGDAWVMLNEGSTALHYEPYGYKIPILNNSQTTNVYLGEVQSTRRIKKLVFDGTENWTKNDAGNPSNYLYYQPGYLANKTCVCSHLADMGTLSASKVGVFNGNNVLYLNFGSAIMNAQPSGNTANGLKEYLTAQYAAGTPVTVWYVLAEPTTGIVNEPLRKISDYADTVTGITIPTITGKDTFDVQTTLKPSEVSLAYTGWHDASAKEWDGSEWQ